jgi:peptidoglycan biosynthesis protein MviN/MurJ (putative lipid II flippase)
MEILLTLGNKIVVVLVAGFLVWMLQSLMTHPEIIKRYPYLASPLIRIGLAAMAGAYALDFFSFYVPATSEVILNVGMLVVLFWLWRAFRKGELFTKIF